MRWVKLETGNSWGETYLSEKARDKRGMYDPSRAVKFTEGQDVNIRWPDGSVTHEIITLVTTSGSVLDHGHRYGTSSTIPYLKVKVHGALLQVCLNEVEVELP